MFLFEISIANAVLEAWSLEKTKLAHRPEFPNCSVWGQNRISISTDALNSGKKEFIF